MLQNTTGYNWWWTQNPQTDLNREQGQTLLVDAETIWLSTILSFKPDGRAKCQNSKDSFPFHHAAVSYNKLTQVLELIWGLEVVWFLILILSHVSSSLPSFFAFR